MVVRPPVLNPAPAATAPLCRAPSGPHSLSLPSPQGSLSLSLSLSLAGEAGPSARHAVTGAGLASRSPQLT